MKNWPLARIAPALVAVIATAIWLFSGRGGLGVPHDWVLSPNGRAWPLPAWGLPIAVVVIFGGAAALSVYDRFKRAKTRREESNSTVTALICLALVLFVWPWALLGPGQIQTRSDRLTLEGRFNVIASQWSDLSTQYFGTAYEIDDAGEFMRHYPDYQNPKSLVLAHVATHPPGAVLFFYGARRFYERVPGVDGLFSGLATALTGQTLPEMTATANLLRTTAARSQNLPEPITLPPAAIGSALFCAFLLGMSLVLTLPAVYGLASIDGGENAEKRGLIAAAFWVLAPTTNLFAFTLDALVAAGVVWTLFFFALGIQKHESHPRTSTFWMAVAGLTWGITSFVSIGAFALGALVLMAATFYLKRKALKPLIAFGAGFFVFWIAMAALGASPLTIVQKAMAAHHAATLASRSWAPWIVLNVVMWALFAGWPLIAALGQSVLDFWRDRKQQNSEFYLELTLCVGVSAILTILLLTVSGNVRGEVERLWLFLLAPICAGTVWNLSWRAAIPLLALQTIQTLLMAATLAPLVRPFL